MTTHTFGARKTCAARSLLGVLSAVAVIGIGVTTSATVVGTPRIPVDASARVRVFDRAMLDAPQLAQSRRASRGRQRVPMVQDFSSGQVIFPDVVPADRVAAIRADPRAWQQQLRRRGRRPRPQVDPVDPNAQGEAVVRDWSYSLNLGSGGTIAAPAKYVFDVNAAPSCTNDFVVTGVSIAGSATQANLIGLNSLYNMPAGNGLCSGTAPSVLFAYNVGPGTIGSYIALSLDGTKVAFTENNATLGNATFHVLRWATGAGNGTSAAAAATPGTGNAAVDTKIVFVGGSSTAPFIDYANDVAYITSGNNIIHKVTGVFLGTPTEVTTPGSGWPMTPGVTGLSTPVLDGVSKHLFFMDTGSGGINYIDDSVVPATAHTGLFSFAPGTSLAQPLVVDSGNQLVYAFSSANTTTNTSVVAQADTSLSAGSQVLTNVGASTTNNFRAGDFNEAYYNGDAAQARLYVVGNDGLANRVPSLFALAFDGAFRMLTTPANGPLALATNNAGTTSSPVTAFYNSTLARQFLFVSVNQRCGGALGNVGCIRALDVTGNAFPTAATVNNVVLTAAGGTGGISIDNVSGATGAASVYYTTRTGRTIVKATQAGLQ
jgi:hypothetical protein